MILMAASIEPGYFGYLTFLIGDEQQPKVVQLFKAEQLLIDGNHFVFRPFLTLVVQHAVFQSHRTRSVDSRVLLHGNEVDFRRIEFCLQRLEIPGERLFIVPAI